MAQPTVPVPPSVFEPTIELPATVYIVIAVAIIVVGSLLLFFLLRYFWCRRMQPAAPAPFHEYAPEHVALLPAEPH
jgi:hypothetical protein